MRGPLEHERSATSGQLHVHLAMLHEDMHLSFVHTLVFIFASHIISYQFHISYSMLLL